MRRILYKRRKLTLGDLKDGDVLVCIRDLHFKVYSTGVPTITQHKFEENVSYKVRNIVERSTVDKFVNIMHGDIPVGIGSLTLGKHFKKRS